METETTTERMAIVFTTAGGEDEAKAISTSLLKKKLAACIQFISVNSYFFWEGEVQNDPEVLLLIKCRKGDFSEIENTIKAVHSYDLPEIIMTDITLGSLEYLGWISEVTRRG